MAAVLRRAPAGGRRQAERRLSRAEDLGVEGQLVAGGIGFNAPVRPPPRRPPARRPVRRAVRPAGGLATAGPGREPPQARGAQRAVRLRSRRGAEPPAGPNREVSPLLRRSAGPRPAPSGPALAGWVERGQRASERSGDAGSPAGGGAATDRRTEREDVHTAGVGPDRRVVRYLQRVNIKMVVGCSARWF